MLYNNQHDTENLDKFVEENLKKNNSVRRTNLQQNRRTSCMRVKNQIY
jgi:hypothetical protein